MTADARCDRPEVIEASYMEYANQACELTSWEDVVAMEGIAAACAELGKFDQAIKWQEKAIYLLLDPADKKDPENRLLLYKQSKPFRDEPAP